jgi:hypothetical protein
LDWTESPFVAAYFAVEQEPDQEGAVFVVDSTAATARLNELLEREPEQPGVALDDISSLPFRENAPDEVYFWRQPIWRSARAVAQQGLTSVSLNVAGRNENLPDLCQSSAFQ